MIGKSLTSELVNKGYKVIILSRKALISGQPGISYARWNIEKQEIDAEAIITSDYIIHLAGVGVMDKKWNEEYKKEILESRTKSSELLIKGLRENKNKVRAVISASAIGWYGKDGKQFVNKKGFIERDPPDKGFLGETCRLWEQSIGPVGEMKIRLVKFRLGIVLSTAGGAFTEFKKSLQFGIAAILGSGKQIISWIHIDDLCQMFIYALENEAMNATYNAVAPNPVTNKNLILKTANRLRKSFYMPVHIPTFVLNMLMGQRSIEILKSTTVDSTKISEEGFSFLYPTIEVALNELCDTHKSSV